ncbi:transporter substrate-binding domain-containing protein [Vibrio profundum]|uniref:substrate-binding periplasmic protein n=1 Tax=Vibrio profundum TaxID=2910247 RepID=UPI003D137F20
MRSSLSIMLAVTAILCSPSLRSESDNLRIATIELFPAGYKENGKNKGFYYEISNAIAEKANLKYVNAIKPYRRVVSELKSGKTEMSILLYNKILEGETIRLEPIFSFEIFVMGRKGNNIRRLGDLSGKVVGTVRDSNLIKNENLKNIELFNVRDFEQGVKMLHAGRLDALIGVNIAVYSSMKKLNFSRNDFGNPYIISSKQSELQISGKFHDQEAIGKITEAIKQLKQDGTIERIISKYID